VDWDGFLAVDVPEPTGDNKGDHNPTVFVVAPIISLSETGSATRATLQP
jgi:hypothetical protein